MAALAPKAGPAAEPKLAEAPSPPAAEGPVHPTEADDVAKAVLKAVARNRREVHVPGYYRLATLAQALTPGIVARVGGRIKKPA